MTINNTNSRRLCIVVTPAMVLCTLHRGIFSFFRSKGWDITTVSGGGEEFLCSVRKQGVKTIIMPFVRTPSILVDLWCFFRLWWHFLWNRYDVIHISTPKALLLGTVAAWLSGHRCIVLTCRGRVYENYQGVKRAFFVALDSVAYKLANKVIPICQELGDALVDEGHCSREKIVFVGASSNGVDTTLFERTSQHIEKANEIREKFEIKTDDLVVLSVGRIRREKGINELVRSFCLLKQPVDSKIHLALLGPVELSDPLDNDVIQIIQQMDEIHMEGKVRDPIPWYAMADLVAFPTYREGFGNVAIEAAAMGLPVVASDIMGCREGVIHDKTGLLVPKQNIERLTEALQLLLDSPTLRQEMGRAGREWIEKEFQPKQRWDGILKIYADFCRN